MSVDDRLAQKIKEKKIMFSPGTEMVKETWIGIYIPIRWRGLPGRVRIGGVNYRTKTHDVETSIDTKDPELKEIVEKLDRIISEKLKTYEDSHISLKNLKRVMKEKDVKLRKVSYGKK